MGEERRKNEGEASRAADNHTASQPTPLVSEVRETVSEGESGRCRRPFVPRRGALVTTAAEGLPKFTTHNIGISISCDTEAKKEKNYSEMGQQPHVNDFPYTEELIKKKHIPKPNRPPHPLSQHKPVRK